MKPVIELMSNYNKMLIIKRILLFLSLAVRYKIYFSQYIFGIIGKLLIPRCAFWGSEFH
jgi:hypothetical protein